MSFAAVSFVLSPKARSGDLVSRVTGTVVDIWEFPKIRDTLFWGPYSKDPII